MRPSSISSWLDERGDSIQPSEFLLEKTVYPSLYQDDEEYAQQRMKDGFFDVEPPVEQLSPKGLSLMFYLFSQKEHCESQPLVASTVRDFENIVQWVNKAPSGTKITLVVQLTDSENIKLKGTFFPALHKTVCQFEKSPTFLRMLSLDGTNSMSYGLVCYKLAQRALGEGGALRFVSLRHSFIEHGSQFSRQADQHSCGIFAIKDARQMHRDRFFSTSDQPIELESTYPLPPVYLKNVQSHPFSEAIIAAHGACIVTRKQKSLAETHGHHVIGYAPHFAQKYRQQILGFLEEHQSNPAFIRQCTSQFDAGKLTFEQLIQRYGPETADDRALLKV